MAPLMTIGDFSRATRLSAKTLRFYHQVGLLTPDRVEPGNGYRLYDVGQIADARVIRTYRSLEMPVEGIRRVLSAPSETARNELIAAHLAAMEAQLEATRSAVAALRSLLQPSEGPVAIELRSVAPQPAVVIRETIDLADLSDWYSSSMAELDRLVEGGLEANGPRGGLWSTELFENEHGMAALFVPVRSLDVTISGRGRAELLPAVDLAVATHTGADDTVAEVYGALGRYVSDRGISAEGPIRETYLSGRTDAQPNSVTEIGWPIIRRSGSSADAI